MSLEEQIEKLTKAVEANTAALLKGGGGAAASSGETKAPKTTAPKTTTAYEAQHTKSEANAAINEVKEKLGVAKAKAIIKEIGFDRLEQITKPEHIDQLYKLSKEALGEEEGGGDGGGL